MALSFGSVISFSYICINQLKERKMEAHKKLSLLWDEMKEEGNYTDYVDEMISQLETLGTQSNTLTKESIRTKLVLLLDKLTQQK